MLEKPDLDDDALRSCLADDYGLGISEITFLPLGADVNTAVYRAKSHDTTEYLVKLRRGDFDGASVAIPFLLGSEGIPQVIAPIATHAGELWTSTGEFNVILYPFVDGESGFDRELTDQQWRTLGDVLGKLHSIRLPDELASQLPHETFDSCWRESVRAFQERVEHERFDDPSAAGIAKLLRKNRDTVSNIVDRAEQLGNELKSRSLATVVCHGDIHAGNVLVDDDEAMYIVDWDTVSIAPKERDLMFIGAGVGLIWNSRGEEALFYQGYGSAEIDSSALAYYRYERIVQDIAAFCEELLLTDDGGEDREQSLRYFGSQFLRGGVVEMACRSDPRLRQE